MAYTREAIAETNSAIPTQAPVIMKEESVFSPYGNPKSKLTAAPDVGRPDNDATPEETGTTEDTVKFAPQVAALARKEHKYRQQLQELKAKEVALEAEKAEIAELKALKSKLAAKDYSEVESLVNYDEYTQYLINKQSQTTPEQQALKKLEAEVEGVKKAHQDNVSKQFEAAVNERRVAAGKLLEGEAELPASKKAERLKKGMAQEAIVQHILDTWEHESKEITVEEAAKDVEQILMEKAKTWASLLGEEKKEEPADEKKQLPPLKQGLKTITNQVTAGDIKKPVKSFQHMSDSERWAEARRRAEERLKQNKG